jgi:hypothetical protein
LSLDANLSGKIATDDLCVVKLIVGPGNAGPSNAPSTSAGIGIEIWLPSAARWNGRVHAMGGGGFVGNPEISSVTQFGTSGNGSTGQDIAGKEGSVFAVTDAGHADRVANFAMSMVDGSFAMNQDGSINLVLWRDFSGRAVHEMALKAKTLAAAFYGEEAKHSYFEGCSTGGRQGHKEAQEYPDDFDGILVSNGAIDWTRFSTGDLYPQVVMQRDLGGVPLTPEQLLLVSSAAVSACDTDLNGQHAGYISDPAACRYDPSKDRSVLCKIDGGANGTSACVSPKQGTAINKIWYGQTSDGSVPDPSVSTGYSDRLGSKQLWFGPPRGTALANPPFTLGLANSIGGVPSPFQIPAHQVALNLQDSKIATPSFQNATGSGMDGWKLLGYADLARAERQGRSLQSQFSNINTNNPNLSRFRDRKGKLIYTYGMADQLIPIQGSMRYYASVAAKMGGYSSLQQFYRFYPIPGLGHCYGPGSVNGTVGVSPPVDPPMPAPNQMFSALVDWVERDKAPSNLIIRNSKATVSRPLCAAPTKLQYLGGDRDDAASYACR